MKHRNRSANITISSLKIGYKIDKSRYKIISSNINTQLYSGELTALLGENGVGKSTLMRTLSSFIPKIEGDINLFSKPIDNYSVTDIAKMIGVVLTDRCLIKNMSVYELVSMGRAPYTNFWGVLSNIDKKIIEESIDLVGISNLTNRDIDTLSDGERQKAMIAKALAQQTPIIFLDEPTAFLDFPSKVEIMRLLHNLCREFQKTIFLSTHDLELALQIADRVWLMDKQQGITTGTPEDLSLNGDLSSFFSRKGIEFDKDSGLFRVSNRYSKKIKVTGHGQKFLMIKKALRRNGIDVSRECESNTIIDTKETNSNFIYVYHNNKKIDVQSIDELLWCIRDII